MSSVPPARPWLDSRLGGLPACVAVRGGSGRHLPFMVSVGPVSCDLRPLCKYTTDPVSPFESATWECSGMIVHALCFVA